MSIRSQREKNNNSNVISKVDVEKPKTYAEKRRADAEKQKEYSKNFRSMFDAMKGICYLTGIHMEDTEEYKQLEEMIKNNKNYTKSLFSEL